MRLVRRFIRTAGDSVQEVSDVSRVVSGKRRVAGPLRGYAVPVRREGLL